MSAAVPIVKGTLYAATETGYARHSSVTMAVPPGAKQLPVHSRCHELLKWEEHPKDTPTPAIKEIHCAGLLEVSHSTLGLPKEHVKRSLTLLKKSLRIEDKDDELTRTRYRPSSPCHNKFLAVQNETQTQHNNSSEPDEDLPSFMTDEKPVNREYRLVRELEREKLNRLALEKEYNALLKQAIDNKFRQWDLEAGDYRGSPTDSHRHLKTKAISEREDAEDHHTDGMTALPQFRPSQVKDSIQTYRKGFDGQSSAGSPDGIYQELANLYDRISQLDAAMQIREEKLRRELLEKELAKQQRKIDSLMKKKNKQPPHTQCPIPHHQLLPSFLVFLLGLLFTKAFLC